MLTIEFWSPFSRHEAPLPLRQGGSIGTRVVSLPRGCRGLRDV
jgi:hypothetical protein